MEEVKDEDTVPKYPTLNNNENYILEQIDNEVERDGVHREDAVKPRKGPTDETVGTRAISSTDGTLPTRTQHKSKRLVPVRWGNQERDRAKVPNITEKFVPTRHSSLEVPRDKFSEEDKLGLNDLIWEEIKSELEELKNLEEFQPRKTNHLREQWFTKCQDIMNGAPSRLPLMREINHHIPLIDQNKRYMYHLPRCPNTMKVDLMAKIDRYLKAEW
ncbi:hypothetical protein NLI96_g12689 [Meripilus lineatus]|uniref:Uncharacterized protein n=1 Tax=Meripilus lineatus TaxID=2056292 RepID=A0AAD5UR53_9APHY|nr:hypothetical protein NLI96_g12689 [Physisporinus lineatus]